MQYVSWNEGGCLALKIQLFGRKWEQKGGNRSGSGHGKKRDVDKIILALHTSVYRSGTGKIHLTPPLPAGMWETDVSAEN